MFRSRREGLDLSTALCPVTHLNNRTGGGDWLLGKLDGYESICTDDRFTVLNVCVFENRNGSRTSVYLQLKGGCCVRSALCLAFNTSLCAGVAMAQW